MKKKKKKLLFYMFKKEKMGNRNWNEIYLIWQMIEEKSSI